MKLLKIIFVLLAAAVLISASCSTSPEPYDFEPVADELKEGPGLFSGEKGEFTIYRKEAPADKDSGKYNPESTK